jgi:hypothetical protein
VLISSTGPVFGVEVGVFAAPLFVAALELLLVLPLVLLGDGVFVLVLLVPVL